MSARAIVLPSPLLGPAAYLPLARALTRRGWATEVAALPTQPFTPAEVLAAYRRSAEEASASVVIAHSNAGHVAAAVAVAASADAAMVLYVDAALPPRSGPTRIAPPALLDEIRGLADGEGLLPPWTRWWDPADVAPLFPDEVWRARVEEGQPRVPLAYLEGTLAVPEGWWRLPSGYLAFGTTYAVETAAAAEYGWPVATLAGHHLHLLADAEEVAAALIGLRGAVGDAAGS